MNYIFLDPEGTQEMGLIVIVSAETGVLYAHQCAGLFLEIRTIEKFAVPLGDSNAAQKLKNFFSKFEDSVPPMNNSKNQEFWKAEDLNELQILVEEIQFWKTSRDLQNDKKAFLELDFEKLADLTEAWIPVKMVYGPGVLVFANSD